MAWLADRRFWYPGHSSVLALPAGLVRLAILFVGSYIVYRTLRFLLVSTLT